MKELRSRLETKRADREKIEAELSELKQNSVPAAKPSEKLTPDAAKILSQLRAKRKKSPVSLADIGARLWTVCPLVKKGDLEPFESLLLRHDHFCFSLSRFFSSIIHRRGLTLSSPVFQLGTEPQ